MTNHFEKIILKSTNSLSADRIEVIQDLWSGYGEIVRYKLEGSKIDSVVIKHVRISDGKKHPRGWNSDLSHTRKLKSYQVETAWYKQYSALCSKSCRIPHCFAIEKQGDEVLIVLEDLDNSGFPARRNNASWNEIETCLRWLANFHATFMHKNPDNLWKNGTYWHLGTRPDELQALNDSDLQKAAGKIDQKLNGAHFKSFVHGDAKLANFCFTTDGYDVAAVDFQYVGGGCGMKDVAYLIGSCLVDDECENAETELLNYYFAALTQALTSKKIDVNNDDVENEWRTLYHFAWADFHRFLKGWSPGHWKIHSYSERITRNIIKLLDS